MLKTANANKRYYSSFQLTETIIALMHSVERQIANYRERPKTLLLGFLKKKK
jgi:hypothetical protein